MLHLVGRVDDLTHVNQLGCKAWWLDSILANPRVEAYLAQSKLNV